MSRLARRHALLITFEFTHTASIRCRSGGKGMADLPIVCTLTPDGLRARREGLLSDLLRQADDHDDGVAITGIDFDLDGIRLDAADGGGTNP